MSIQVENNLKNSEDKELFEQKAHYIPCHIEEDGPANVKAYFEPYVVDKGNEGLSATFRGHSVDGVKMQLPEGYRAVIVTEGKRPLSEDAERKFQVIGGFKELTYWNWDKTPSSNDNLAKSMVWMDIAETVELSTSCICHPCWKKADKASQEDLATSTSQPPTHNHTNHSNSIALPNYCRAIATSSRCFVRGCQKTDRSRVTDSLRKKILDKYNYYIPQNNRLCKVHEKDQSWVLRDKEDGNSLNVFTAVHIQDMFSLSSVRI
ncbi:uncharacterized protein LOC112046148 isoform X1 [Bicyclus anynana]|uniref:Uncharacterized protein LOC112046148 isoform X1 n=1 Tax=Bicyclus anynana TaxID=110368 RepID=A0ABM3M3Y3_BICAN|nr:uncharacterized protein LOC112046148 isoform X1 [Bicyclus anynana]